ncbi:Pentatricopeptide repeat-containing protein, partial [Mucuna pruriens]
MIFHWNVVKKEPLKLKLKLKLASITRALSKGSDLSSLYSTSNNSESESENLLQLSRHCHTLSQTKQVHAFALLLGLLPRSVSLCASLILQYASFSRPTASLLLFQRTLPHSRTAFLWNTLIRANSIAAVSDGFTAYNAMVRAGVQPDECTYPFVLKGCSDFVELHKGREVHGVVVKLGFHGDVFVGNTLLAFYGNCGLFRDAMKVFDEMPERDKVSWNTVISLCSLHGLYDQARWFFRAMVAAVPAVEPDLVTVVSVLPVCAETEDEVMARIVHCYVLKVGLLGHVKVGNALVDVYGKCGSEQASWKVFDEIDERNVVSWNAVITSFSFRGKYVDALDVFRLMIDAGVRPNSVTISSMLPVLGELGLFKLGMEVHGFSLRMAIESDVFIANSLIDMYAKSGSSRVASVIFNKMGGRRSIVSWNAMIANFAQNRLEFEAVELVRQMQAKGETPNNVTFTNVLPACARLGFLNVGKEIHARIIQVGSALDLFVSNALTDMYSKCGCLNLARNVFNISVRDEVSYNILIIGYSRTNDCSESLSLFSEMRFSGMSPDIVSFMGVIAACANLASIRQGKEVHGLLMRKFFHTHLFAANSLLDLYTRAGLMEEAADLIRGLSIEPDTNIWGALLGACRIHGNIELGLWAAEHLFKLKPQHCGYYILLSN